MQHIKELIYKMADDCLIVGHRNSEWTGIGPVLEEDIAFSSMAQDQIGHAWALYRMLHEVLGEETADTIAFLRPETKMKNAQLCELPAEEYDIALMRNFYFNHAQQLRFESLAQSGFKPLADLAKKIKGELKYHVMHNDTWIKQLGNGSEESHARMQSAANELYPYALGMFENGEYEKQLIEEKIFEGEESLKGKWHEKVNSILSAANLKLPDTVEAQPTSGGRQGLHTEHLKNLLLEMREVLQLDTTAEW